jgi:hypothetical protein
MNNPNSNTASYTLQEWLKSGLKSITSIGVMTVCLGVLIVGCTKNQDDFGPQNNEDDVPVAQTERIVVLNEGNFMFGNGSVSVINNFTNDVAQNVFKAINDVPLGDVPQSMIFHDSLAYIVVNNSSKIEVVKKDDFSTVNTITGLTSPRQMIIVSENPLLAWVTDIYANKIWEIDLIQGSVNRTIPIVGWSENIYKRGTEIFVLNKTDSAIHELTYPSGIESNAYSFGGGVVDFQPWGESYLMVLARDGIYIIELDSKNVELIHGFGLLRNPSRLAVDPDRNTVYFIENDVYKFKTELNSIIQANNGTSFYSIQTNKLTGELFITDAKDYVQPGELIKYNYELSDSIIYQVGVNPQFVLID